MKTKYFLILVVFFLCFVSINGQEGHPDWWWDTKSADFIVEGTITYDPAKYYELSPVNVTGKDKKYYWLVGNIKINKVLFINKHSQHLESYQQYLKEIDKEHPALILARQSSIFSHSRPRFEIQPIFRLDKETTVLNLSQIYIFPLLNLKLESAVPRKNINEAKELLDKRPNNYLDK
jgi:hypothetical protein